MSLERLDKIISNTNGFSRSQLKKLAAQGRVMLNGEVIKDLSVKADGDADEIAVDGVKLNTQKFVYIMQNKPKDVVSASEGRGDTSVIDILPPSLKRSGLFPAGRLDKDTTGFVLITDDGDFAHRILSPKKHIPKTYIVTVDTPVNDEAVKTLEKGIELHDGTSYKPSVIKPLDDSRTKLEVIIFEGKYHEIKRMFKAVGSTVTELQRIKMGALMLDSQLKEGQSRLIAADELKLIENKPE